MARRSIPAETKAAVVAAAQVEGANLREIATQFGVSLPSVYNWVKAANTVAAVSETIEA